MDERYQKPQRISREADGHKMDKWGKLLEDWGWADLLALRFGERVADPNSEDFAAFGSDVVGRKVHRTIFVVSIFSQLELEPSISSAREKSEDPGFNDALLGKIPQKQANACATLEQSKTSTIRVTTVKVLRLPQRPQTDLVIPSEKQQTFCSATGRWLGQQCSSGNLIPSHSHGASGQASQTCSAQSICLIQPDSGDLDTSQRPEKLLMLE